MLEESGRDVKAEPSRGSILLCSPRIPWCDKTPARLLGLD